ncbi:MAG: NUDIX hydrolase [Candidatus Shapirobacteria bacterium]|jgi:8-oxo-dGTP pyrophosphatase MutT (NUDIX family)|nr:NUDIX hydrolase [Candidatus Shapirobacteria bacterium]
MPEFGVATKAIIFNTKLKKFLVLKKSDLEDINPNTFDMPGGRIRFGEKLEEAVVREAKEETGLDVEVGQVFNAWTFAKENKGFQLTGVDFFCTTKQEKVELSEEHSNFEWISAETIINDEKYPEWLRKTIEKAERTCFN